MESVCVRVGVCLYKGIRNWFCLQAPELLQ